MSVYRQYEDPYKLEQELEQLKKLQVDDPYNDDIAIEIAELNDRINFAWQDDEAEMEGYE